ncbi:MAG: hypothetical protein KJ799_00640 [Bacteroidetes bacterium]|nr:hypothetical protein [Bacteroidota bacterium]
MKKINAVFFVLFITLIIGCSSDDKSLVGKWNGTDQIGTVQTFNFIDSENIEWTISNDHFDLTEKVKYKADFSTSPMKLDIYGFPQGPFKGKGFYGIFEFVEEDKLKVDFEAGIDETIRPADFQESAVVLERAK